MLNYLKFQLSQVCLIINLTAKYICYSKLLFNAKIFRCILLTWINYLSFSFLLDTNIGKNFISSFMIVSFILYNKMLD